MEAPEIILFAAREKRDRFNKSAFGMYQAAPRRVKEKTNPPFYSFTHPTESPWIDAAR
jgi:hypothetical protein